MANNIIKRVWNQGSMTPIEDLQGSAFTNENGGHTFQISGVDSNGEALALSGTVAASFLRPDQTTVGISGSVSGGVASVTLSEECYGVPGRFGLVIFLTSDGKKTAIYSCVGNVARSSTDAVAPGVVADVVDLINEIEAAVDTIPASYSALMADIAPTYSSSALYAVGDYAWYEGDLKRCIVPITVGETYTPAHWTSAVVGDDVCALKSAINHMPKIAETEEDDADLYVADSSGYVVVKFSDGHIQTQNFDSSNVGDLEELETTDKTSLVDAINEVKSGTNKNAPSIALTDSTANIDIADSRGNVIVRFENGHIYTKNFDSSDVEKLPVEYKFSGNDLLLGFGYSSTYDAVIIMNAGRANGLFDFSAFKLKPKGASLENMSMSDLTSVWISGTDMHSPFQFLVTSNADGYYSSATDPSFTGGNHTVTINGNEVQSANSKYIHYFADGRPVASGHGHCNHFEIRWANEIQAYNCVKADGTGRASLVEYHDMIFDGVRFNEEIRLVPLEEIKIGLWYGLQTVSWGTTYNQIRFRDATNRGVFSSSDSNIVSGNAVTSGIQQWGQDHALETTVDITCDLGKRDFYSGTGGAFTSGAKTYYRIIYGPLATMPANAGYYLRGSYRFYPVVA